MNIIEELDMYDGEPLIHIRQDESGQKYYCHAVNFTKKGTIYLMVPVSDNDIEALKAGNITYRSILDRPERQFLTWDEAETITPCLEVPSEWLPNPDVKWRL